MSSHEIRGCVQQPAKWMWVSFDKACVCLTQAGEASSERESEEKGGVWEFLSQEGLNGWERESRGGEEWKGEKGRGGGVTEEDWQPVSMAWPPRFASKFSPPA